MANQQTLCSFVGEISSGVCLVDCLDGCLENTEKQFGGVILHVLTYCRNSNGQCHLTGY